MGIQQSDSRTLLSGATVGSPGAAEPGEGPETRRAEPAGSSIGFPQLLGSCLNFPPPGIPGKPNFFH